MQAIAKTYSPEVRQWAARLHHRRMPRLSRRGCQWVAWAQALIDRFAGSAAPVQGTGRTLLRRTSLWTSYFQRFAPQIEAGWQTSISVTRQGDNRTFLMSLPPAPSERTTLLRTLLSREYNLVSSTFLRMNFLRHSTQSLLREVTRHTLATRVVEAAPAPGAKSLVQVDAAYGARRARAGEPEPLPLVKRVLLQNRRIEEQMAPPQAVLLPRTAPQVRDAHFPESAPPAQVRPAGMNMAWMPPPTQAGFNINQITDEVVRQLDSRLIAARDRFGKI